MSIPPPSHWAIVVAVGFPLLGWALELPKGPQPAKPRIDLHGDPLPQGAVARLGTGRFRHAGAVHAVAFSTDGKLLAASNDDKNMVVIWDRATGRKLRVISLGGRGLPNLLRFSRDAKRLYGSFWGGESSAWDVKTGARAEDLPGVPLSFSPDAREALLRKGTDVVRWDLQKGKQLGRYPRPGGEFSTAAWAGECLLVPCFDGTSGHFALIPT